MDDSQISFFIYYTIQYYFITSKNDLLSIMTIEN